MFNDLSSRGKAMVFAVIALGLSLLVSLAAPVLGETSPLVTMLTPSVAAAIMLVAVTSEGRSRAAWVSLGVTRTGLRGWPLAIVGPALALLFTYVIVWASPLGEVKAPASGGSVATVALNLGLNFAMGLVLAMGEEVGWRGYMLPRLAAIGVVRAMLLVGFVQGLWHLPLLLTTPYYHSTGNPLIVVPLFLATLTLAGVFYGYLRLWTGSVWPVAIAHAVYNLVWAILNELTVVDAPETLEYVGGESGILIIAVLGLAALVLARRTHGLSFTPLSMARPSAAPLR